MPASTGLTDDWNIDFINKILSHKDMTISWDGRTAGTSPALGDYVRGDTSGAVAKVIGGTFLGSTNATGTIIATNVRGRFEDGEQLRHLDELPFDTIVAGGFAIGETLDEVGAGTAQIIVDFIEYNHPGDTAGDGTIYGRLTTVGWLDGDDIENSTPTTVATVDGAEVDNAATWDGDVNGLPTSFTVSGVINYDGGTVDIPNDALVLSGERATGVFDLNGQPNDGEVVVLGSQTLTPLVDEVLIAGTEQNSLRNLINAINNGAGEGTDYANGTLKNTTADMGSSNIGIVQATARTFIPSVTTTTSTTTVTGATWTAATLDTGASGSTGRGRNHARTLDSVTATGTYIVNDIDGVWAENDAVFIDQVLLYDTVEAGQAFAVGDVVQGQTSGAQGRVLAVTSTRLILAEQTLRFEDNEPIHRVNIDQTTTDIADVQATAADDEVTAVVVNHPNSQPTPRVIQKELLQGGLLASTLNPVRHVRQFYNFLQDKFDEFDQMDDVIPMSGQVKNAQYTIINGWFIPDRSMRFLDSGSIRDSASDNVWANPQSLGSMNAVGTAGYAASEVQPQLYVEQDGVFVDPRDVPSLEGHINLLIKITTNTDNQVTATGSGAQIDSGRIRVYNRFFLHTYSHFFTATNATGGVVTIALATSNDLNNTTGTDDFAYTSGAGTWAAGEEIVTGAGTIADPLAVGVVVTADTGATGNVTYVLKSTGDDFVNTDVVLGQISQVNKTSAAPTQLVAGYSDQIGFGHVDSNFTGGTTGSGPFHIGEEVSQGAARGIILEDETAANTLYIDELDVEINAWDGTTVITGDISGASYTPTTRTADTVAPKDIGDEIDNDYTCIFGLDKTDVGGRTIAEFYEYTKYLTSKEADASFQLQAGRNQGTDVQGRLYRKVDQVTEASPAFAEQVDAPYGIKAGSLFLGARSVFVQNMATADIQNFNLIDDAGTGETPPNVQTLEVTGLAVNDRVVVYETDGVASTTIKTGQYNVGVVSGANNGATDIIVLIKDGTDDGTPLLADTPSTGTIRVEDPNNVGLFLNITYGSRVKAASTFTLDTTAEQPTPEIGDVTSSTDLNENDDVYVVLLSVIASTSTESQTIEFDSVLNIMTRVRKRGILPFEVTGQFTATGASVAAIRTTDPVVDPV